MPEASLWSSAGLSLALVFLAEFGDKSQLVCMNLAARHRPIPVVLGASSAFAALNLVAVLFGGALASWLPEWLLGTLVALLFAWFGIDTLRAADDDEEESTEEKGGMSIFLSAFTLILFAELGDKTQISVAGLGTSATPLAVWLGATTALILTSTLGAIAGRTLLQRLPIRLIHRISGILFLILAALAILRITHIL